MNIIGAALGAYLVHAITFAAGPDDVVYQAHGVFEVDSTTELTPGYVIVDNVPVPVVGFIHRNGYIEVVSPGGTILYFKIIDNNILPDVAQ